MRKLVIWKTTVCPACYLLTKVIKEDKDFQKIKDRIQEIVLDGKDEALEELADEHNIKFVPTIELVEEEKVVKRIEGIPPKEVLEEIKKWMGI